MNAAKAIYTTVKMSGKEYRVTYDLGFIPMVYEVVNKNWYRTDEATERDVLDVVQLAERAEVDDLRATQQDAERGLW